MKTFQSEFIDNKQNIKIPLLQRDYVQGGRIDIIEPFLNQLISALKDGNHKVNLNYIYGYNNGNVFIPIDGQQRLITLWLLHLYIYAKKTDNLPVKLNFESREFADNFCEQLRTNLCSILKEDIRDSLKEKIKDSNWFVSGWLLDTSVCNMLNTLQHINAKRKEFPDIPHVENITFDFLDMKDQLDDDVYVKMNGRGRPLSYFENLKSWMDEHVKKEFGEDDDLTKNWRTKMDNDWTDLFWNNRNKNQKHPEEIDDEQLRLFYSLLLLYWKKNKSSFCINESDDEKGNVFKALLECKKLLSLYQFEKYGLFNREVFQFINDSIDVLNNISKSVNELQEQIIGILELGKESTTILYKIALKDASYEKKLPLLYALVKTPISYRKSDMLFKWVRLWRNLILNSNIGSENIGNVCCTIDNISQMVDNNSLYEVVSNLKWEKGFGFNEEQFKEEIAKAKQILNGEPRIDRKSWEEIFIEAENYAFFKGAIRFLFTDSEGKFVIEEKMFDTKYGNARKYFDEKGVKDDDKKYRTESILMKSLIANSDNFWILWYKFRFSNDSEIWKNILLSNDWSKSVDAILKGNLSTTARVKRIQNIIDDGLLDFVCNEMPNSWLRDTYHDYDAMWQSGYPSNQVVLNPILAELKYDNIVDYCKDNAIMNCRYYKCVNKNVDFTYDNHYFRWWGNPNDKELDVYLMNENWNKYIKRPNPTTDKNTEKDTHYCFRVTKEMEADTSIFTHELDSLILAYINDSNIQADTNPTN